MSEHSQATCSIKKNFMSERRRGTIKSKAREQEYIKEGQRGGGREKGGISVLKEIKSKDIWKERDMGN